MKMLVGVNEKGLRVGEDHPNARLTNAELELFWALRDEGWSYGRLAAKFEISKSGARKICRGQNRCQVAVSYRTVHVPD